MQDQMIESKFNAAVKVIRSLPKNGPYQPSHDMMLKFYGLYKQATEGPCKESKPSFYEVIKGYKWHAWTSLGSMSKIEAMNTYVEELKKIVETMAYSNDVASFIEALGPFYEYVDIPGIKTSDDNHNITNKHGNENASPDHALYNGKTSPVLNGDQGTEHEKNIEVDIIPELVEVYMKSHKERIDRSASSSPLLNGDTVIVNGIDTKDKLYSDVEIIGEHEIESTSFENGIKSTYLHSLKKKVMSDTDSDEEYSEPAETPELLQQKQKQRRNLAEERSRTNSEGNSVKFVLENYTYDASDDSPVLEIVTCGGGDATDAGRIRFAQAHQGESDRRGDSYSSSMEQDSARQVTEGSGGGRRRRRNSEDPRHNVNVDVNVQLIYILQKIHQDLEAVVVRLDSLESQALRQHQEVCALCRRRLGIPHSSKDSSSWWPFPELSPRSTFFLLTWPFVLQGAIKLLRFIRSRRLRKMTTAAALRTN